MANPKTFKSDFERGREDAQRELAEWMIAHGFVTGHGDTISHLLGELLWQINERIRQYADPINSPDSKR